MLIQDRTYSPDTNSYRFGFNGKETENAVVRNSIAYEARIFDPRLARFISTDPWEIKYSWQSTYAYFANSPISKIDYLGKGDINKKIARQDRRYARLQRRLARKFSGEQYEFELGKRGSKKRYGSIIGLQKNGLFTFRKDKSNNSTGTEYEEQYDNRKSIYVKMKIKGKKATRKNREIFEGRHTWINHILTNEGDDPSEGPIVFTPDGSVSSKKLYIQAQTTGGYRLNVDIDGNTEDGFRESPTELPPPGGDPDDVKHGSITELKSYTIVSNSPQITVTSQVTADGSRVHAKGYPVRQKIAKVEFVIKLR